MTISLTHATVAAGTDAGIGEIRKLQWNEEHTLTMGANFILGRATAGTGAVEEIACTAAGRALLDDADAAAQRATLGLVIGTNVQAWDADLDGFAALAATAGFVKKTGAGTYSIDTSTYLTMNQTITLSGDVSGSGSTSIAVSIGANKVTNAMLAQVATATFKGRSTAATGNVEDMTAAQATALLNAFTSTLKGLAPASGGGTANFLRADGTWAAPTVSAFPSGTLMLFQQTAAPTGWTKQTTHNDKALRVVSGTVGTGGTVAFSTAMANRTVSGTSGSTTLDETMIPSHTHKYYATSAANTTATGSQARLTGLTTSAQAAPGNGTTISTGGGGSHNHSFSTTLDMAVQYVDVIVATKD